MTTRVFSPTVARCTPRRDLAPTFQENEMEKCWEMFNTRIRGRRKKKELFLTGIHTCFVKVAESFVCLQKLNYFVMMELYAHSISDDIQISIERVELLTARQICMLIY